MFFFHTSNFQIHTSRGLHDNQVYLVLFEDGGQVVAISCHCEKLILSGFSVENATNRLEFAEIH